MTDERLSDLLDLWKQYMEEPSGPKGLPAESLVLEGRYISGADFEEMAQAVDRMQAKAVNAAIDDLPMVERVAVHHVKLASVWRLRYNIEAVYATACEKLKVGLGKRGIE